MQFGFADRYIMVPSHICCDCNIILLQLLLLLLLTVVRGAR